MVMLKKSLVFIILILLLISCRLYISDKYNVDAVVYDLENAIDYKELSKSTTLSIEMYELRYSKSYMDFELIMTTGRSEMFRTESLEFGSNLSKVDSKGIVLGDEVAGYYFNVSDAVGETLDLFGNKHTVLGIKENSNEIILPFSPQLLNNNWSKMKLYVQFYNSTDIYSKADSVDYFLKGNGATVRQYVVNSDIINFFDNLIIIILLIWLVQILIYTITYLRMNFKLLNDYMLTFKNRKSIFHLCKDSKKEILYIILSMVVSVVILIFMIKIGLNIKIPLSLMPSNILSLGSWIDLIEYLYDKVMLNYKYGFMDISRDFVALCSVVVLAVLSLNRFYYNRLESFDLKEYFQNKKAKGGEDVI